MQHQNGDYLEISFSRLSRALDNVSVMRFVRCSMRACVAASASASATLELELGVICAHHQFLIR